MVAEVGRLDSCQKAVGQAAGTSRAELAALISRFNLFFICATRQISIQQISMQKYNYREDKKHTLALLFDLLFEFR